MTGFAPLRLDLHSLCHEVMHMKSCYITFRSVTYAQRGESVLRRAGIRCAIQRTPRWMEERGCGYCLGIPCTEAEAAVAALREQQVLFGKVFEHRANEVAQELIL